MQYYLTKDDSIELVRTEKLEKKFHLHNHPEHYVISKVISGKMKVQINGEARQYKAGEQFWVFPFEPHWVDVKQDSHFISLCLRKELVEQCNLSELVGYLEQYFQGVMGHHFLTGKEVKGFKEAIEVIYKTKEGNVLYSPDDRVDGLTEKMIAFPEAELSLNKMAENCYFSKYHFLRIFKNHVGLTPHQFQIQSRIRKAQCLLRVGESILDTSVKTGFYDQSHFNKCFLKIVGIPPKEYIVSEICMDNIR